MPKRKFPSKDYPSDSFVETEVTPLGVVIEVGYRDEHQRRFDRMACVLNRDNAILLVERLGRDLGLTVTHEGG